MRRSPTIPGMVLLHGGTPRGAERIAACWADNRKVTQILFKPDWDRDGKAAPFKRNDALLAEVPQAVIVFPGTGITDNLADKAKRLGILELSTTARRLAPKRQPLPPCDSAELPQKRPALQTERNLRLDSTGATEEPPFSHSFVLRLRGHGGR